MIYNCDIWLENVRNHGEDWSSTMALDMFSIVNKVVADIGCKILRSKRLDARLGRMSSIVDPQQVTAKIVVLL